MIYATLYVHGSVLLEMRHSGFYASTLTQGFGMQPYFVYNHPMVGVVPMLVVAAAPPDDNLLC